MDDEDRRIRFKEREREIIDCYGAYAVEMTRGEHAALPPKEFVLQLARLNKWLGHHDAMFAVTSEGWKEHVFPLISSDILQYARVGVRCLLQTLYTAGGAPAIDHSRHEDQDDKPATNEEMDLLHSATTFFRCTVCHKIERYPEILYHRRDCLGTDRYSVAVLEKTFTYAPAIRSRAEQIMHAIGLPEEPSSEEMHLLCACGHPRFSEPLTTSQMVKHIIDELDWYDRICDGREMRQREHCDTSGLVAHNDHDLEDLASRVHVIQLDDMRNHTGSDSQKLLRTDNASAANASGFAYHSLLERFCRLCAKLGCTVRFSSFGAGNEIRWHMESKHFMHNASDTTVDKVGLQVLLLGAELDGTKSSDRRALCIAAKLQELGCTRSQFPHNCSEWNQLMYEPKDLTDDIWDRIFPRLQALLMSARVMELEQYWKDWEDTLVPDQRATLPSFEFFTQTNAVNSLLAEENATKKVTHERWKTWFLPLISLEAEGYYARICTRRLLLLQSNLPMLEMEDKTPVSDTEIALLKRATALFECDQCWAIDSYPAVLRHFRDCGFLQVSLASSSWLAECILRARGITSDIPSALVSFTCPCSLGDPEDGRLHLSMAQIIQHLLSEHRHDIHSTIAELMIMHSSD